jgi:inner membrane transporter RhtA
MMLQVALTESGPSGRFSRFGGGRLRVAHAFGRLPPTALLLLSLVAVQLGSALATVLFSSLGPAGTAWASTVFSAVVLTMFARPRLDRRLRDHALLILLFGLADACMVLPFFLALQHIPLGVASAITFLGPLGIAAAMARRPLHFLWIGIAALGIGLLTPAVGGELDPFGLGLAALAAAGWAGFVPLSKLAGRAFDGVDGLTLGLWASAAMLLPFALAEGTMLSAGACELGGALAVALLSAVLPMALEYRALQRMSARAYGILVTLEPAIGALVGAVCLGQEIGPRMSIAVACVTIAALGVTLSDRHDAGN